MNWLKNFKIRNKFFLAFSVFILIVACIAGQSVLSIRNAMANYKHITEGPNRRLLYASNATVELANIRRNNVTMSSHMDNPEAARRHFILANNAYSSLLSILDDWQKNLENDKFLPDNEKHTQIENFDELRRKLDEYMNIAKDAYSAQVVTRDRRRAVELAAKCVPIGDQLVNQIGTNRTLTQMFIDHQANMADEKADNATLIVTVLAATLLVLTLLRDLFLASVVTSPLKNINKSISQIEKGNLNYPIRLQQKDELGLLSNHIGDMVDKISDLNKSIAIIDNLELLIFVTDFNYNIIFANNHFSNLLNIERDGCMGKKCYKIVSGEDEPCPFCPLPDLFPKKDIFPTSDWERPLTIHDAGEEREAWFACRSSIVRWTDGSLALFNAYTDETIRKQHADQLFDSARLAEDASRIKSSFLANMSHEIRTPMNSIIGFSELALDSADLPPQTRGFLENIKNSSEGLLGIINDILDISKIEAGKIVLENIPFDLQDVFKVCQSITTTKAAAKSIDLFCYSEPTPGKKLIGDPTRLRQCILNLLTNSVKFTNYGIVKLLASVVSQENDKATIHFEVKDSGIGMTDEQIEKVFDPFTQADNSTTRKYGGTGLGLTITKNFIELMGGTLIVESAVGIGSKFCFDLTFPTCDAGAPAETANGPDTANAAMEKPYFGGAEILVCEDHDMNQMVITEHLTRVGIKATIAENGKVGIEIVAERMKKGQKPFDLIFMDIHMPVMDGLEAVQKLGEMGNTTPIVALTANVMTTDQEMYIEYGMHEYLSKPFATHDLWNCLLRYIKPTPKPAAAAPAAPTPPSLSPAAQPAASPVPIAPIGAAIPPPPPARLANEDEEADAQLRLRLINNFLKGNQKKAEEIKAACVNGDIKLAHRLAHTLKGVAGMVGQPSLQGISYTVEQSLEKGDVNNAMRLMTALDVELKKSLAELAAVRQAAEPETVAVVPETQAQPINRLQALELIEKLRPMLESGDGDCLELISGLKSIPASNKLIEQVEDYDFEPALETLEEIKSALMTGA